MADLPGQMPVAPMGVDSPLSFIVTEHDRNTLSMVRDAVDAGRVLLAYQPVMRADRPGHVGFYEGLIRVLDHSGRVIPARDFMYVVETTELGRKIDSLALGMGLAALAETPDLRLAINMSARSIGYPKWLDTLNRGLAHDPSIADRLILEITESSAMVMPETVMVFMSDLQHRGIAFALDDFGAGYTSFRYLKDFYFDILKIDGQFIRGIHANSDNQVMTQALISIAQHFEMFTVAEFVESAEDAAFLTAAGIDCMQGYYFGAPTTRPPWQVSSSQRAAS